MFIILKVDIFSINYKGFGGVGLKYTINSKEVWK